MTAAQFKRIRTRLERAAKTLQEAQELYDRFGGGSYPAQDERALRDICYEGSKAATDILSDLVRYDMQRNMRASTREWESTIIEGALVAEKRPYEGDSQVIGWVTKVDGLGAHIDVVRGSEFEHVTRKATNLFRIPVDVVSPTTWVRG